MSRSNGPVTRTAGQPPAWQHSAEADPSAAPLDDAQHYPFPWPQQQPQQHPGYAAHPSQQPAPYPPYHFPEADNGQGTPGGAPVQHPPFFGPQPATTRSPGAYAPQFDRYANAQQQSQPSYQRQDNGLAQLQTGGQARQPLAGARDELREAQYDQWQPGQDTRNYDLGSYMPAPGAQTNFNGTYDRQWQEQLAYGAQGGQGQGYYSQQGEEALPVAGHPDDHDHDESDYEFEEPRRGRRGLVIIAALVGAIAVGGGLAYAYKTIIGPGSQSAPPVIKADKRPAKTQPADPGGKQFAHTDSKLMGRLEPDSSPSAGSTGPRPQGGADTDASGVRRVPTVVIGRDGSIAPPPAEPRLPPAPVSVPGMTIVDGFAARPSPPQPVSRPADPAPAVPVTAKASPPAAPPAPVSVDLTPQQPPVPAKKPAPAVAAAAPAPAVAAPAPVVAAPPPAAKKPATKQPSTKTASSAPKAATAGYVAVLSSQRSRMDALKTFADLQQKYTSVLQDKIPDVQEADLSARGLGTMYRVVVGPPSSREAALDLCGQLKSAGYNGCWVTPY